MDAKRGPKPRRDAIAYPTPASEPGGLTGAERAEFRRLQAAMESLGTFDKTDVSLVEAAARTSVLLRRAYAALGEAPLVVEAANKTLMPNPNLKIIAMFSALLRRLLADLGLTPKSARLGDGEGARHDARWGGLIYDGGGPESDGGPGR